MLDVVGREQELAFAAEFLEELERGPTALVFEGEAGIGKSTLWRATCDLARERGFRVLVTRPVQPDKRLSFVGLGDLLLELEPARVAQLPPPQRMALDAALLRGGGKGSAPDRRAVFTAVLSVLTALAAEGPLLVAVDDVQWLDPPSARALEFVARRVTTQRIGLLLSSRAIDGSGADDLFSALDHGWRQRHELRPLTLAATQHLLKQRLERRFQRPTLIRIHQSSGGNPFFALELASALGASEPKPGEPLPAPDAVRTLVHRRIEGLSKPTRRALLRAAVLSEPTVGLVGASLAPARRDGLIDELPGRRLVFAHPLYASAVYDGASSEERRRAHRELAEQVEDVEERARHLALATSGPDERVAVELDHAAERARARGASEIAAQLSELAIELTPFDHDVARRRRQLEASDAHLGAGAIERGTRILQALKEELPQGVGRAAVLWRLAGVDGDFEGMVALAEQARREATDDEGLLCLIHLQLAMAWPLRGIQYALRHGRLGLIHAERSGEHRLVVQALALLSRWELWAGRNPSALIERAVALEEPADDLRGYENPRLSLALWHMYRGELDEARALDETLLAESAGRGDEIASNLCRMRFVDVAVRSGDWQEAAVEAAAVYEFAEQIGLELDGGFSPYWKALVDAHLGHIAEARSSAELGSSLARDAKFENTLVMNVGVLGFIELSLGNEAAAYPHFKPALDWLAEKRMGLVTHPTVPNALEALVAVGDLETAPALIARFEREARTLGSSWALAIAGRLRGMLAAADGNFAFALAALEGALEYYEHGRWPFEHARTLLARGRMQRRVKQKAAAKESLEGALAIFEQLGAPLWGERTRAELARVGLRRAAPDELTENERRVAEHAASGLTNREVAAQLYMSPKTVEANLARVYRKLGIHSRAELGARLTSIGREPAQT